MSHSAEIVGEVCSGLGEGRRFTRLDWAVVQFQDKLGFSPHPGTFNLRVADERWPALRARLEDSAGIAIEPPAGFCGAKCFAAMLDDVVEAVLVLPDVRGYPESKVELIAPFPLRATLGFQDGDSVKLHIEY